MVRTDVWRARRLNENFPAELGAARWDVLDIAPVQRISLELLDLPPGLEQAVILTVHVGKGTVSCGDLTGRGLAIWLSGEVRHLDVEVVAPDGLVTVEHAWREPPRGGNPEMVWKDKPFSAMLIDDLGKRRVYRCNNGHPDDDFDKLVFSLELVDAE